MKKILLVLVGGTICTLADRGVRKIETEKARAMLVEHFRRSDSPFADESALRIDVGARFDTLSENMSFPLWNKLKEYFEGRPYDGYDGVIVAHGTDTLAYTAAMFSFLLLIAGRDFGSFISTELRDRLSFQSRSALV